MKKFLSYTLSTFFGAGYFPKIPGTFGSLVSLPVIFSVCYFYGFWYLLLVIFIVFVAAVFAVKEVLKYTEHDPSIVVIDEFIGQAVTFLPVADFLTRQANTINRATENFIYVTDDKTFLIIYFAGFVLFRIFDILKPYPASYADKKMINAYGVILDDVFAGIYAAVILKLIVFISWSI